MTISDQVRRLIDLGVAELAAESDAAFRDLASGLGEQPDAILAVHPSLVPASRLARLLRRGDSTGFVVSDMTDVDRFAPIAGVAVPDAPLYLLHDVRRGDEMRGWTPDEALVALAEQERSPLTLNEGISWLLQDPDLLTRNHCFMTIASRVSRGATLDPRTPALWISNGTGRDGRARLGAPKVGWCWAGNRHSWLGFASAARRS